MWCALLPPPFPTLFIPFSFRWVPWFFFFSHMIFLFFCHSGISVIYHFIQIVLLAASYKEVQHVACRFWEFPRHREHFFFFAVKMALRIDYLYTAVCKANGKGFEEPFEVEGSF